MNLGVKSITLRFDDNQLGYLQPVQGDTKSRGFLVEMVSTDGEVLDASSSYECRLYGVNSNYPDKTFYTVATVEEGRYKLYLSTDMVSKAGTLKLQVALYKGSQELIQSEVKEVEVSESMANGGNIGKDLVVDFTKLEKALERVDTQEKAYKDSLGEQRNIKADIDRKQKQVSTDTTAVKKIRQDMEGVMAAEAGRVSAEKDRQSKEKTRQSQEQERRRNESGRMDTFSAIVNVEEARQKAEAGRNKAENSRASAEKDRQSQESTRESNEDKRKSNETSRQNAESSRVQQYDKAKQLLEILGENPTVDLGTKVGEIDDKVDNLIKTIPYPALQEAGTTLQKVTIWEDKTGLRYRTENVGFIIDESIEIPIQPTTKEISFKAISDDDIVVLMTDQKEFNKYFRLAKTGRQYKVDVTGVEKIIISCINNLDAKVKIWDFMEVE